MKRIAPLAFTAILTLASLAAMPSAGAEAYGFKGALLGSHVGLVANNPKYDCRAVNTPTADRVCGLRKDEQETMAGVPVESVFYYYDQGLLTGVVVHLDEKRFQTVVEALRVKYGSPVTTTETLKTLAGTAFENRIHTWRQAGQSIVAQRYSGRVDKSSIRILDDGAAERIRQRRDAVAKQPARDL